MIGINDLLGQAHLVENEYIAFIEELKKLEVSEYPTKASASLIEILLNLASERKIKINEVQRALISLPQDINIELVRREILALSRELTGFFTQFIEWIDGAQTQKVPWSLISYIEFLSKEIAPENELILYCKSFYNYGIHWFPDLDGKLGNFNFVSLPKLHKNDILLHTLIGHELFHPLCGDYTDSKKKEVAVKIVEETKKEYPDLNPEELFGQKELSKKIDDIMKAWERALHELMCDIACGHIFGPVALWAMTKYATFSTLNAIPTPINNFYPPWQYRFEMAWQYNISHESQENLLCELEKHSDLTEITKVFRETFENYKNRFNSTDGYNFLISNGTKEVGIAYTHVRELLPKAAEYIKAKKLNRIKTWIDDEVINQIPILLRRIRNGIPPNEIFSIDESQVINTKPVELASILLTGCIYQIYRESTQCSPDTNNTYDYHTLSRLLLKACEDSMLLRPICNDGG